MTEMKWNRILVMAGLALWLTGCGGNSTPPPADPPAEPSGPQAIAYEQLFDSAFVDKEVAVEGYFRLPFSIYAYDRLPLEFYARPDQRKGKFLIAKVPMLDSTDAVLPLPPQYSQQDLRILTHRGDTLDGTHRFRIKGFLRLVDVGEGKPRELQMEVAEINLVETPPADLATLNPVQLDSSLVADSTRRYYLVVAEGLLEVPSMMFALQEYWLWLEGPHGKVAASFKIGAAPNQIDTIPDKFKDSDVKVFDYMGKRIDLKRPVRVYGDFSGPDGYTDGDIYVGKIEQLDHD